MAIVVLIADVKRYGKDTHQKFIVHGKIFLLALKSTVSLVLFNFLVYLPKQTQ